MPSYFVIKRHLLILAVLLTAFAVTTQAAVVAYWPFDADPNNVQGNATFDGTLVGGAVISGEETAVGSGALKIDTNSSSGSTSVKIDPSPFVGVESAFSVTGWFRFTDISGDGSKSRVFVLETDNYLVSYGGRSALNGDGQVEMGEWYMDGTSDVSGPFVDPNSWHHFALVYNANDGYARHYFDGELRDWYAVTVGDDLDATNWLNIGDYRDGNGGRNWDGYIDDVAVYDVSLTDDQVAALAAKTSTPEDVDSILQTAAWNLFPDTGTLHVLPGAGLSWEAPADVATPTYNVLLSTASDMSGAVEIASGISETTTTLPANLTKGAVYYWRVDTIGGTASEVELFTAYEELVAWWTFDTDLNLTNTYGSSDYDGEAIGGAVVSTEDVKIGTAALKIDDDTSSANLVTIANSPIVGMQDAYTISAWYKYSDISSNGSDARNFVCEIGPNFTGGFGIREAGTPLAKRGQVYVNKTGTDFYNDPADGPVVDDDEWHHFALVWDGSTESGGTAVKYYHDGVLFYSAEMGAGYLPSADVFNIGDYRGGNGDRNWDGYIDDMAVYDIVLTPDQVSALAAEIRNPLTVLEVLQLTPTNLKPDGARIDFADSGQGTWDAPEDMVEPRYDVYLSADPNMVNDVMTLATAQAETSIDLPALTSETTYYWRVDATAAAGGDTYESVVASFTTSGTPLGLIAYWPFDVDPNNVQGNADLDGTLVGSAVVSAEDVAVGAGALKIDDDTVAANYVDVANTVLLGEAPYRNTVVAWYKYEDIAGDGSDARNFVWETDTTWALSFGISAEIGPDPNRVAEWYYDHSGAPFSRLTPVGDGPNVQDDSWHHVAMVFDYYNDTIEYYHDGALYDLDETEDLPINMAPTGFHIGNHRAGDGARAWDGYIDEVAVYDVALTSFQVSQLVCNPAVTPDNVLAVRKTYADFDDDGDVDIDDLQALAASWLTANANADFDCSGIVDLVEFSEMGENWMP